MSAINQDRPLGTVELELIEIEKDFNNQNNTDIQGIESRLKKLNSLKFKGITLWEYQGGYFKASILNKRKQGEVRIAFFGNKTTVLINPRCEDFLEVRRKPDQEFLVRKEWPQVVDIGCPQLIEFCKYLLPGKDLQGYFEEAVGYYDKWRDIYRM